MGIIDALFAGGLYINFHTAARAAGEIRGQILPASVVPIPLPVEVPPLPVWLVAHRDLRTNAAVRYIHDALKNALPTLLRGKASALMT